MSCSRKKPEGTKTLIKLFDTLDIHIREPADWIKCSCGLFHSNRIIPESYWDKYKNKKHHKKKRKFGVILKKGNQLFVVQTYNNYYGFPKGSIDENENGIQCAQRELYEESGIKLNIEDFKYKILRSCDCVYYFIEINEDFEITTKPIDDIEITSYGFYDIDKIYKLNFSERYNHLFKQLNKIIFN